jgi:hypothetical protein
MTIPAIHVDTPSNMRFWFGILVVIGVAAFLTWTSDSITMQGERTIYTVGCTDGAWQGAHCTGRLVPAERYRFRALSARGEVLFWVIGANEPSSRFTNCKIQDGRNWSCPPNADASKSITLQMLHGDAVHDETGRVRSFHAVPKWRWALASYGMPLGGDAGM